MRENNNQYVEIWGDHVQISDVMLSVIISVTLALGGFILAPNEEPKPLIFGLIGSVAGFIISSIFIKPKRTLTKR